MTQEPIVAIWRKSTRSSGSAGGVNCVQVAVVNLSRRAGE